jgi:hypothetical protein
LLANQRAFTTNQRAFVPKQVILAQKQVILAPNKVILAPKQVILVSRRTILSPDKSLFYNDLPALRASFKSFWGNQFPQTPHKGYLPRALPPAKPAEAPLHAIPAPHTRPAVNSLRLGRGRDCVKNKNMICFKPE